MKVNNSPWICKAHSNVEIKVIISGSMSVSSSNYNVFKLYLMYLSTSYDNLTVCTHLIYTT